MVRKKVILHNSHINPLTPGRTGTKGEQIYQQKIHQLLADLLEEKEILVDIYAGKNLPMGVEADLYLTLHLNGATNEKANGFCVSIYPDSTTPEADQKLKGLLIENLSRMPIRNHQGYETENSKYMYGLTRISKITPGALVELGFATNPNENGWLQKNIGEVAGYVKDAVSEFLKEDEELTTEEKLKAELEAKEKEIAVYKEKIDKIKAIVNS